MVKAALKRAIRIAGTEAALARGTRYSQPAISKALKKGVVSPKMALAIEDFTAQKGQRVDRHDLCPKIFGKPVPSISPAVANVVV